MVQSHYDVLIVGGGHGGAQAAIALRQRKFAGSLALVGEEPELPYERPPLSKEYFSGEKSFERIMIRPENFWRGRDVVMNLGRRVCSVDPDAHVVSLSCGTTLSYGKLIWATGGTPRRMSCDGHALRGIHGVRTRADIDRLLAELPAATNIVVIGGGYIGLESAAVLSKLGKRVTIVEALDRVLARVAGPTLSRFYEAEHRAHGVDIRLDAKVDGFLGLDKVMGVRLAGGEVLPADVVITGIGIIPSVDPLAAAGAKVGNGVEIDPHCRTSLTDIYAIGDCAFHANAYAGGTGIRLESVQNANDQATVAAEHILGGGEAYNSVPWFWSNQFDLRLQTVGLLGGFDDEIVRGNIDSRAFSILYLKQGRVLALDCVNMTRDYAQGKALVASGRKFDPALLADPETALKSLL